MTATRSLSASLQHMSRTLRLDEVATLSDAELIGRFVAHRDEAAFAALVRRYGAVVFGVCRRVLRHEQDAEDAFQATFLVFARDAAGLHRTAAVGNWLYGVAHNVSRKARTLRLRRATKERTAAERRPPEMALAPVDDLSEIIDGELSALPNKYRAPIVLCDLLGLTMQQAAEQVGCPPKTLGTRLSRARGLLAQRLTRRGVAPSAAAVGTALAPSGAHAAPAALVATTAQNAAAFVNGSAPASPAVAVLITGVSNAMLKTTIKYTVLACVLLAGGFAAGPLVRHLHATPAPREAARETGANATGTPTRPARHDVNHARELHRFLLSLLPWSVTAETNTEDKKDKAAFSGTWVKKEGEMKLTFEEDELKLSPHGKDDFILIVCSYTADKDGTVKAKVMGYEGKDEAKKALGEKLPVGTEFSFKWKPKNDLATLEDVKGEKAEVLKSHLEGEFTEKN